MTLSAQSSPRSRPSDAVAAWRAQFPALDQEVHGRPLVYLDNAASSLRCQASIDAELDYYQRGGANVHRGLHALSERGTAAFEGARGQIAKFLNAARPEEIVLTRGTTEAINLVANSFVRPRLRPGDEVLITALEHHSNIVPWQLLCAEAGARLVVAPVSDRGELIVEEFARLLNDRSRIAAFGHVSNALGTVNPVAELVGLARQHGVPVLIDGAQAAPHLEIDVQALGCDFYAFSGHKVFGPSGIGALYGRHRLLLEMPPWQGGGDMILSVSFERTEYNVPPHRFEAGTPNVAGAIGLGAALGYLESLDREALRAHEAELLLAATAMVAGVPGVRLVGTAAEKVGVLSFVMDGTPPIHPHDVGTILDREGIAIRAGHHCAQPLMARLGLPGTARASFAFYNTLDEVAALAAGLRQVRELFG